METKLQLKRQQEEVFYKRKISLQQSEINVWFQYIKTHKQSNLTINFLSRNTVLRF